jgi:hypothetical protein
MRAILITCAIIAGLLVGAFCYMHLMYVKELEEIKPYVTYTRLVYLASGCDKFKNERGAWPSSLAELQAFRADFNEFSQDMWGRALVLVPYNPSMGYGQVISYGRDGKQGGTGADADLEVRFPSDSNVVWNAKMGQGLRRPSMPP